MSILPLSLGSMCCVCGVIAYIHSSTCLKNIKIQLLEQKKQKTDHPQPVLNQMSEGSSVVNFRHLKLHQTPLCGARDEGHCFGVTNCLTNHE